LATRICDALGIARRVRRRDQVNALRAAIKPGETRLVWLDTPANPLWGVADIAR
jgi:cystathionine gamma-synthase